MPASPPIDKIPMGMKGIDVYRRDNLDAGKKRPKISSKQVNAANDNAPFEMRLAA
tara:strand:- start:889 stop:1053 length:165 start_codon:yes stop_codon:yes gene_type:complete